MTVETIAGTRLAISAGTPATYDATGYAALTYTSIGEITDVGTHGKTYAEVKLNTLGSAGVQKFKGSYDLGNKPVKLAVSSADAGQVILYAALAAYSNYAFKQTYQNGDVEYFSAKVMSIVNEGTTSDSVRALAVGLGIDTPMGSGIVRVLV